MKPTKTLLQAIAVTVELTGTSLSEDAARVMAQDLARYPENQVLPALTRCRREIRTRLTVADVVARLDDGRPGPEQAWAMSPRDEAQSVVWTEEMAQAYGAAVPLIFEGDLVAARMAFLETYRKLVLDARDRGEQPKWTPSLGTDPWGRDAAILAAQQLGRLTAAHIDLLLAHREQPALAVLKAIEKKE